MEFEKGTHIKNGINYSGGGGGSQGTTDYEDLENQPQINGVTLIGNKAVTAFGLQEVVELTKAEYDALPDTKLTDNKAYHITDYAEYSLDTGIITDAYSSTKTYTVGEYCIYNNSLYRCILACTGVLPTNTTYWEATSIADELSELNTSQQITDLFDSTTQYLDSYVAFIVGKTIQIQISSTAMTGNFQLGIVKQKYRPVVATYLTAYLFSGSTQTIVSITTNGAISVNNISGTAISTQGYGTYIIA